MMPVFLGLTLALILLAAVIGQTVVAQRDARRHAMTEGDALIALQRILAATVYSESGQRGYLLTQDRSYLQLYNSEKGSVVATIAFLRDVDLRAWGEPGDKRIARIEALAKAKFEELDRTIEMTDAGFQDQALAVMRSDIGKLRMDALRTDIRSLAADKARLRRAAFDRAAALERRLVPLVVILGIAILGLIVAGFRTERSRARAEAEAAQAGALREANDRAQLLARELNHRVKNLFSVILSIVTLSARKKAPVDEVVEDIRARIHALSRAHVASQGKVGEATVQLRDTIGETMKPYVDDDGRRVRIEGPDIELPVRMVTPIGLIVHELATNAAKYGALTAEDGAVAIRWAAAETAEGRELTLSWIETGGPAIEGDPGDGAGFGARMTALAASQLGGRMEREWPASGAVARICFPLPDANKE